MYRTKANWKERLAMVIAHLLRIVDALVFFGTLTFFCSDLAAKWLFSDLCERWTWRP